MSFLEKTFAFLLIISIVAFLSSSDHFSKPDRSMSFKIQDPSSSSEEVGRSDFPKFGLSLSVYEF